VPFGQLKSLYEWRRFWNADHKQSQSITHALIWLRCSEDLLFMAKKTWGRIGHPLHDRTSEKVPPLESTAVSIVTESFWGFTLPRSVGRTISWLQWETEMTNDSGWIGQHPKRVNKRWMKCSRRPSHIANSQAPVSQQPSREHFQYVFGTKRRVFGPPQLWEQRSHPIEFCSACGTQ
jgi:hypothetical protein